MAKKLSPIQQESKAEVLFKDWKDITIDKNKTNMHVDFARLFDSFSECGIGKEIAKKYVDKATAYYTPSKSVAKWVYDRCRLEGRTSSDRDEFIEGWCDSIDRSCRRAFYAVYPPKSQAKPDPSSNYFPFNNKEDHDKYREYVATFRELSPSDFEKADKTQSPSDMEDFIKQLIEKGKEAGIDISRADFKD